MGLVFSDTAFIGGNDRPELLWADTGTSIIAGTVGGFLYRYDEATAQWTQLPLSGTGTQGIITDLNVTPTNGKWYLAAGASPGQAYQYDVVTGTAVPTSFGCSLLFYQNSIYIPSQTATFIFRSYQGDIFTTTNGLGYKSISVPPSEAVFNSVLSSTNTIYWGGEDAPQTPLKSPDYGKTWTACNNVGLGADMFGLQETLNGDILIGKSDTHGQGNMFRLTPTTGTIVPSYTGIPGLAVTRMILRVPATNTIMAVFNSHNPRLSFDDGYTWTGVPSLVGNTNTNGRLGNTNGYVYYSNYTQVFQATIGTALSTKAVKWFAWSNNELSSFNDMDI